MDESLPRLLSGRYRLDAKVGQGGMGVVYRGHDLVMQRPVAVKLVRTRDGVRIDEAITGRFLREAKHTARILHDNIVDVFDLGRGEDGDLFFVMELLEGQSLSQVLQTRERIEPALAAHVGAQIADALDAAHRGGIVHRDLKPANVMLVARGQDTSFVKVLDFGVAKAHAAGEAETALTRTGVLVGTIDYMAPEQILGKKIDGRTDIYSLGVVLYRIVTGTNPFRDALMPAMINNHLNVMPEPMSARLPPGTVSAAFDRAVEKCIRKNPDDRFATMADVARALRAVLRPDPTEGLPELGVTGESDAELGEDPFDDAYSDDARTRVQRRNKTAVTVVKKPREEEPVTAVTADVPRSEPRQEARASRPAPIAPKGPPPPKPTLPAPIDGDALPVLGTSDEHDDFSALKTQIEPGKRCAMCNTSNLRAATHCVACGVGLHTVEQAAVRARVSPGERDMTKRMAVGPLVAPPAPQAAPAPLPAAPPFPAPAPPPGPAYLPPPAPAPQAAAPPPAAEGMWTRMLRWAGIKG